MNAIENVSYRNSTRQISTDYRNNEGRLVTGRDVRPIKENKPGIKTQIIRAFSSLFSNKQYHYCGFTYETIKFTKSKNNTCNSVLAEKFLDKSSIMDAAKKAFIYEGTDRIDPVTEDEALKTAEIIYNITKKNISKLSTIAVNLNNSSSRTIILEKKQFEIIKTSSGEVDIHVIDRTVGEGAYKLVKIALSILNTSTAYVQVQSRATHIVDQKKKNREAIKKEYQNTELFLRNNIPNILKLHQIKSHETQEIYYFTEYCDGGTLTKALKTDNLSDIQKKIGYFIEIAKSMKAIHDIDWAHQDLKPDNIFLKSLSESEQDEKNFEIKIGDFSDAAQIGSQKLPNIGTEGFINPASQREEVSLQDDVCAFGGMLREFLKPYNQGEHNDEFEHISDDKFRNILKELARLRSVCLAEQESMNSILRKLEAISKQIE